MDSFGYNSSSSMLLLSSPQGISENINLCNALLRAWDRKVFRLIALDDAHLYAMGMLYRLSIRQLKKYLFAPLFKDKRKFASFMLSMTATMPFHLLRVLKDLTYVDWTLPQHLMQSSPKEFRQRYIDMDLLV